MTEQQKRRSRAALAGLVSAALIGGGLAAATAAGAATTVNATLQTTPEKIELKGEWGIYDDMTGWPVVGPNTTEITVQLPDQILPTVPQQLEWALVKEPNLGTVTQTLVTPFQPAELFETAQVLTLGAGVLQAAYEVDGSGAIEFTSWGTDGSQLDGNLVQLHVWFQYDENYLGETASFELTSDNSASFTWTYKYYSNASAPLEVLPGDTLVVQRGSGSLSFLQGPSTAQWSTSPTAIAEENYLGVRPGFTAPVTVKSITASTVTLQLPTTIASNVRAQSDLAVVFSLRYGEGQLVGSVPIKLKDQFSNPGSLDFNTPHVGIEVGMLGSVLLEPTPDEALFEWVLNGVVVASGELPSLKYIPQPEDVGKTLVFRLTMTKAGFPTLVVQSKPQKVRAGILQNDGVTLLGTPAVGETVAVDTGYWFQQNGSNAVTATYQWLRDGKAIAGATSVSYNPVAADVGKTLSVKVTFAAPGHETVTVTVKAGKVTKALVPSPAQYTLNGSMLVGATLSINTSAWDGGGYTLKYQWLVDNAKVKGATKSTFVVPASAYGKYVGLLLTVSKSGYQTATFRYYTSSWVGFGDPLRPNSGDFIVDQPVVGKKIKVRPDANNAGFVSGTTFRYQWIKLNGNVPIPGATSSTFTPTLDLLGQPIGVMVTAQKTGYPPMYLQTYALSPYVLNTYKTVIPKIVGTAKVGQTLSAVTGAWYPTPGLVGRNDYTFQWLRNGKVIAGATGSTYTLVKADKGKQIQVRVSVAANGNSAKGYGAASATSAKTAKVK